MRVWGRLRCRDCCLQRLFVSYDSRAINSNTPDSFECEHCGFMWGKSIDDTAHMSDQVQSVVSAEVAEASQIAWQEEVRETARQAGVIPFSHAAKHELARRRGVS